MCKFAILHKNDAFVTKIANTRPQKFLWPFLPSPKSCQLMPPCRYLIKFKLDWNLQVSNWIEICKFFSHSMAERQIIENLE